ncbi:hypothetical protein E2K60_03920, partial [Escherichia coli]
MTDAHVGDSRQRRILDINVARFPTVYVMSEAKYRMLPDDIGDWYVRAADGQMVPFSAFSSSRWEYG